MSTSASLPILKATRSGCQPMATWRSASKSIDLQPAPARLPELVERLFFNVRGCIEDLGQRGRDLLRADIADFHFALRGLGQKLGVFQRCLESALQRLQPIRRQLRRGDERSHIDKITE